MAAKATQAFRRLVSGERTGVFATLARLACAVVEIPYAVVVRARNVAYDRGSLKQHRVEVPVICVGNLTMGGTGKTPMVEYLARWFRQRQVRVAIVSRGYRAVAGQGNDEAKELAEKLPDVPHIQNPDRVAASRLAIDELDMQLILLDDGFQHRRLARDVDIVLIDALEPFGYGHLFPRGMLREPLSGLRRARLVALTRADLVSDERRRELRQRVCGHVPEAAWIEVAHQPAGLARMGQSLGDLPIGDGSSPGTSSPETGALESLRGKRVVAFCGIGNPNGFRLSLESCGVELLGFHEFPDHHDFTREDVEKLREAGVALQPDLFVCTHKDLVKIELERLGSVPLRALIVEMKVLMGEPELHGVLLSLLSSVE